jgi:hypothetical protein
MLGIVLGVPSGIFAVMSKALESIQDGPPTI